jgi:hypothetical protein
MSCDAYILYFMAVEASDSSGGFFCTHPLSPFMQQKRNFRFIYKFFFINFTFYLFLGSNNNTETIVIDLKGKQQIYDEMEEEEDVTKVELIDEETGWDGRGTQEEIEEDLKTNIIEDEIADSCAENISIQVESMGNTADSKSLLIANKKINVERFNDPVETVNSIAEKKSILRTNFNNEAKDYCGEKIRLINSATSVETMARFVDSIAENTSISINNPNRLIDLKGKQQIYDEMEEEEDVTEVELIDEEAGWDGRGTQEEIDEDLKTNIIEDEIADSCAENISIQVESTGSTAESKSLLIANKKINVERFNDPVETVNSIAEKKSILRTNFNNEAEGYCGEKIRWINSATSVETMAKFVDSIAENTRISKNNPNSKEEEYCATSEEKFRWVNNAICVVKDETVNKIQILTESEEKKLETQIILSNKGDKAVKTVSEQLWESKAEKLRNSAEHAKGTQRIINILLEPMDSAQKNKQIQADHVDNKRDTKNATEHADTSEFIPVEHEDTIRENIRIPAESATNKGENLNTGIEDQCITQEDKDFLWKVWTA